MENFSNNQPENSSADNSLSLAAEVAGKKNEESEGWLTVDVFQDDDNIVVKSAVAGVNPDNIDISINEELVKIKGARSNDESVLDQNYYYREIFWGPFSKSIILPEKIDSEKARASMKNGVLTIILPKLSKTKTKKLQIDF